MKMKNRSNGPRSRHEHKYSKEKCLLLWRCLYVLSNTWATFEAQFLKKLSNTEVELKESVACIKKLIIN